MTSDPYWNTVGLLLKSKPGATTGQQNNTVLDSSTNNFTITRAGNVTQGSFSPYGSAGGSLYFDGVGDYLTAPANVAFQLGTGDFTIECWFKTTSTASQSIIGIDRNDSTWCHNFNLVNGNIYFYEGGSSTGDTSYPVDGNWHHIAAVRQSGIRHMFVDGVLKTSVADTYNISGTYLTVGSSKSNSTTPTYSFNGYISDLRILKGTALYTASFTPPADPLTAITNTQLLLAGTNATVKDYSGKSDVETGGTSQVSTAVKKFTEGTLSFDGTSYLTLANNADFNLGSDNFTIETWVYIKSFVPSRAVTICGKWESGGGTANANHSWFAYASHDGTTPQFRGTVQVGTTAQYSITGTKPISVNTWYHYALVRNGTTLSMYVNGVRDGSVTIPATFTDISYPVTVGGAAYLTNSESFLNGYIDDLRITKGVARYLNDFAVDTQVPVDPRANQSTSLAVNQTVCDTYIDNVSALLLLNEPAGSTAFTDSGKGKVVARVGNVVTNATGVFNNSSAYFDGSGDYLYIGSSADFAFGTGDFTVELWCYMTEFNSPGGTLVSMWTSPYPFKMSIGDGYINAGPNGGDITGAHSVGLNTWCHVAYSRNSGTARLFLNGTQVGTNSNTTNVAAQAFYVGVKSDTLNYNFKGNISDLRITKGVGRYVSNFSLPTVLSSNNSNNTFVDSSANNSAITRNGNVSQGTFSPFSNSGFGTYFNGTTDYLTVAASAAFGLGTGDFTIETWLYKTNVASQQGTLVDLRSAAAAEATNLSLQATTGIIQVYDSGGNVVRVFNTAIKSNEWTHVAYTRQAGVLKVFINGIQETSTYACTSDFGSSKPCSIVRNLAGTTYDFGGYLSNLRIVKGTAVYTSNFTPSTTPLTAVSGTSLLTCQDNRYIDRSPNNFTVIASGTPKVEAFSPFAPTTYSAATNGGSMYFDGTGDYVSTPSSSSLGLGSGDFTLEAWVYPTTSGTEKGIIDLRSGSASGCTLILGTSNALQFQVNSGNVIVGSSLVLNVWNHVAAVKSGSVTNLYLNGVQTGTIYTDNNTYPSTSRICVGADDDGSPNAFMTGYIADVRLTKGSALYTAVFTPPTAPLTPVANTQLLLAGTNAAVYDNSGKVDIELLGTAKVSTAVKKYSSSIAFDGTAGCYGVLSGNPSQFTFGTGDFTIECWFKSNSIATAQFIYSSQTQSGYVEAPDIYLSSSKLYFQRSSANPIVGTTTLLSNTWYHVALSRVSGITKLFLNGVQEGSSYTDANNYIAPVTGRPLVGRYGYADSSYFNGYIEDLRITKGVGRYATGFTVPATTLGAVTKTLPTALSTYAPTTYEATGGDPYYNQVVLHMHMDGSNGGTVFADQKGNAITVTSPALLKTDNKKFGVSGAYFSGSAARIAATNTAFTFGTGDFTIECWVNTSSVDNKGLFQISTVAGGLQNAVTNSSAASIVGGFLTVYAANGGYAAGTISISTNTWTHIALVRSNGVTKSYVNGVVDQIIPDTYNYTGTNLVIGGYYSTGYLLPGYIDEVRVTKGIARYTSNFTVPTAAFPDYQDFSIDQYVGQSVLLKATKSSNNNTLVDSSTNNFAITRYGNVAQGTFSPFSNSGFSTYFDSTSTQCLIYPSISAYAIGTGDFTLEFWVNLNSTAGNQILVETTHNGGTGFGVDISAGVIKYNDSAAPGQLSYTPPSTFIGTWHHLAVSRAGTSLKMFVDGVMVTSATNSVNCLQDTLCIGGLTWAAGYTAKGYISNVRIVKGYALYTTNFTPPSTALSTTVNGGTVSVLTCCTNSFKDISANAAVPAITGAPAIQAFSPLDAPAYNTATNGGSLYFDGTGDYVTVPTASNFMSATGDWTWEAWVYPLSFNGPQYSCAILATANDSLLLRAVPTTSSSTNLNLYSINDAGSGMLGASGTSGGIINLNTWSHVAAVRQGSSFKVYLNGVQVISTTSTASIRTTDTFVAVGRGNSGGNPYWNGYIADVRLINGTVLYITNFTPPTAPLTPVANTQLLLSGTNAAIIDTTGKVVVETVGSAKADLVNKKYSSSLTFNGTTDCLQLTPTTLGVFGTGDFTIETWLNAKSLPAYAMIIDWRNNGANSTQPCLYLSSGTLTYLINSVTAITGSLLSVNTWYHIALSRASGVTKLFVNGIQVGSSYTDTVNYTIVNSSLTIGATWGAGYTPSSLFNGQMEDLRITKGVARYV